MSADTCKKRPIRCKWVYRIKISPDGQSDRFKDRLVVKGYSQKQAIDYCETFAPVARCETIRTVLTVVAANGLVLRQIDIMTAFLNSHMTEKIYMHQLEEF